MQAVISVLDEHYRQQVVSLWEEFKREFHMRATSERVPFPTLPIKGPSPMKRPLCAQPSSR